MTFLLPPGIKGLITKLCDELNNSLNDKVSSSKNMKLLRNFYSDYLGKFQIKKKLGKRLIFIDFTGEKIIFSSINNLRLLYRSVGVD